MWTARRILKELTDTNLRKKILTAFWRYAEPHSKLLATHQLAQAMRFRDETLKKMPNEKKAELLASRVGSPEFDQFLEMALMQYHTHEKTEMMSVFLDRWAIPHENGSIEADEYKRPTAEDVRSAVAELTQFEKKDVAVYLASAGLLMDDEWRAGVWPVAEEMASGTNDER
jgi:hypothetical protein